MPIKHRSVNIPPTRDPFINTPLIRLTPDPKTGAERFWISTWNSNVGSTAALVDEHGKSRIYRFKPPHFGFYSATQENDDTLWLCGDLSRMVRFTLSTGKLESFETGAPSALNFQGMVIDKATGKLFAAAFPPPQSHGVSYDYKNRKISKVQPLPSEAHYARFSFPNGDGTWSMLMHLPGEHLIIWDPRSEKLEEVILRPTLDAEWTHATTYTLVADEGNRRYVPDLGWYNPRTRKVEDGPRPEREMTWDRRLGNTAIGCNWDKTGITVGAWDLATGKVREVCRVPDSSCHSFSVTDSGKVVAVNTYGNFFRFDLATGALECSQRLDSDSIGSIDCMCLVGKDRVLGTPFITQRFFDVDLKTGKGEDLGRAAPGAGEIMKLTKVGKKVYMGAYTGAELMEYDPSKAARFPENPRVVADPPGGMRPVAIENDGRVVWYSSSWEYGHLGSPLTRYDTKTGLANYAPHALPDLQIQSICYEKSTRSLMVGSTIHADCQSCPAKKQRAVLARLNANDFSVIATREAPEGFETANIMGPAGKNKWLVVAGGPKMGRKWYILDGDLASPATETLNSFEGGRGWTVRYAGKPGRFVLTNGRDIELWDYATGDAKLVKLLHHANEDLRLLTVDGRSVLYTTQRKIHVLDNCL